VAEHVGERQAEALREAQQAPGRIVVVISH
jgi:hypothetical protein